MKTKNILKKQLANLPCRYILGVICPSERLSPRVSPLFIESIEKKVGGIEDILPPQDFPNPPESYILEMGYRSLSTTIIIFKKGGSYTWLHHYKKKTDKLEKDFINPVEGREFNINPGAVGTYGVILASHKPTGDRPDLDTYAYGLHPHLFFGGHSYYERIMRWTGNHLELVGKAATGGKFPEYAESSRVARFEELVRGLPKSDRAVELLSDCLSA